MVSVQGIDIQGRFDCAGDEGTNMGTKTFFGSSPVRLSRSTAAIVRQSAEWPSQAKGQSPPAERARRSAGHPILLRRPLSPAGQKLRAIRCCAAGEHSFAIRGASISMTACAHQIVAGEMLDTSTIDPPMPLYPAPLNASSTRRSARHARWVAQTLLRMDTPESPCSSRAYQREVSEVLDSLPARWR